MVGGQAALLLLLFMLSFFFTLPRGTRCLWSAGRQPCCCCCSCCPSSSLFPEGPAGADDALVAPARRLVVARVARLKLVELVGLLAVVHQEVDPVAHPSVLHAVGQPVVELEHAPLVDGDGRLLLHLRR